MVKRQGPFRFCGCSTDIRQCVLAAPETNRNTALSIATGAYRTCNYGLPAARQQVLESLS